MDQDNKHSPGQNKLENQKKSPPRSGQPGKGAMIVGIGVLVALIIALGIAIKIVLS